MVNLVLKASLGLDGRRCRELYSSQIVRPWSIDRPAPQTETYFGRFVPIDECKMVNLCVTSVTSSSLLHLLLVKIKVWQMLLLIEITEL